MNLCTPEAFCQEKRYCLVNFRVGVSLQLTHYSLLVLHINSCNYPNKITTVGSRGNDLLFAQASVLFRIVAISGGKSIIYFLNAHCISISSLNYLKAKS